MTLSFTATTDFVIENALLPEGGLQLSVQYQPAPALNLAKSLTLAIGRLGVVKGSPGAEEKLFAAYQLLREVHEQISAQPSSSLN